ATPPTSSETRTLANGATWSLRAAVSALNSLKAMGPTYTETKIASHARHPSLNNSLQGRQCQRLWRASEHGDEAERGQGQPRAGPRRAEEEAGVASQIRKSRVCLRTEGA